tara:strand:- start:1218 stop:2456 length:1239 start_codon:yes stop_codon:yes gene_type:complete
MGLKEWLFGEDPSDLQEEALAATWHAANEMWAFNWATAQDNYAYQQETNEAARMNSEASRKFREQQEYNGWLNRENMRLFEYSKQVEAYNASVASYEEQLDYNQVAVDIAINDANRVYQDKLIQFGFQNEDLLMKYHEAKAQSALDIEGIGEREEQSRKQYGLQIRETEINRDWDLAQAKLDEAGLKAGLAATKADAAFKSQESRLETTRKVGQQRALGQSGRSAQKAVSALLANYGQGQAALAQSITDAESKYMLDRRRVAETLEHKTKLTNLGYSQITQNLLNTLENFEQDKQNINLKISQLKDQTEFGREQLQRSIISAGEQDAADRNRIEMDRYQQDINAASRIAPKPIEQPPETVPMQIPETVFVDPQKPTPPPKPVKGVNTVPGRGLIDYVKPVLSIASTVATGFG